jgi:hypothetical protein
MGRLGDLHDAERRRPTMLIITNTSAVVTAPSSRAYAPCGWNTVFFGATDPMATGSSKPHHQRPKEASPPT